MKKPTATPHDLERREQAPLITPTDLETAATRDIAGAMNAMLADVFALYLKTKNFHWHMSGPHFRDYHLLLDEQGDQIFAMTDPIAERVRKIGRHDAPLDRPDRPAAARARQRCRLRRAGGHAGRTARRQQDHWRRGCAKPTTSAKSIATSRPRA